MDNIAERIRSARMRAGLSQFKLAEKIGLTPSAVNQYEQGRSRLSVASAVKLAEALDVSLEWLVNGDGQPLDRNPSSSPKNYAPVLNRVQAGQWGEVVTPQTLPDDLKYMEVDMKPVGYALALQIDGESMLPMFEPQDIIIVDTGLSPLPGDYVVAMLANETEATFKKYRPRGSDENGEPIVELAPLNPDYPVLTLNARSPGRIVGTMIEHRKYRRRRQ